MEFRWFSNMKITAKVLIGFAAVLAVNATVGLFCLSRLEVVQRNHEEMILGVPTMKVLADLRSAVSAHWQAHLEYQVARSDGQRQEAKRHLHSAAQNIQAARERYGTLVSDPEQKHLFEEINDDLARYLALSKATLGIQEAPHHKSRRRGRLTGDRLTADLLLGPEKNALGKVTTALQSAFALDLRLAEGANRSNSTGYELARQLVGMGVALSAFLTLLLAFATARIVVHPLRRVIALADSIAAGDLTANAAGLELPGEAGELEEHLYQIQQRVRGFVEVSAENAQRITLASDSITLANRRQTLGANAQKEHAQQLATAMESILATMKEMSNESGRAAKTASQAAESAGKGGGVVDVMLTQIEAIASSVSEASRRIQKLGESDKQIEQVISVIDDIAGQANLLALNAAIEAARAGEQGRGFAVVAGEVTKLAERTTKATKEIAATIGATQAETRKAVAAMSEGTRLAESGKEITRQVGVHLRSFMDTSQELGGMLTRVATAVSKQSAATDYMTISLEQISKVSRESVESALQSETAVAELAALAAELSLFRNRPRLDLEKLSVQPEKRSREEQESIAKSETMWDWIRRNDSSDAEECEYKRQREKSRPAIGLALAARNPLRPGVAKIHARLLTDAESLPRPPSISSAKTPA
jgi:methyl-accepting chemotaxis protein